MLRFLSAFAILLLALTAQFALANAGLHLDLVLAVLITFAFTFNFWELAVFVLFSVFLLNWKSQPSDTLILFALIPLAAFAFRKLVHSEAWIGNLIAIIVGFLIFSIAPAPTLFLTNIVPFLMDLIVGLLVGEIILLSYSQ